MRVLFLVYRDFENPAAVGGDFFLWELAKGLSQLGHSVTFMCSSFVGSKLEERQDGIKIVRLHNSWGLPFTVLAKYMREFKGKFDVVVEEAFGGQRFPFFSALYVKEPSVVVWHQRHEKIFRYQYPFFIAAALSFLESFLAILYREQVIVTPSRGARETILPLGFRENNVKVVYDGVDKIFDDVKSNGKRESLVVCLGKLRRYKRLDHALFAFEHVLTHLKKPCHLVIAGKVSEIDTGYVQYLRKLAKKLGIDEYVDFRINISEIEKLELLEKARLLVQPSPVEGFSIVVAEANRCGTPVVVSDGVPRDVVIDGLNGFMYPFGNVEMMAEKIAYLMQDDIVWSRMSNNAREWSKRFTWEKSVFEFNEILKQIQH